MRLSEIPDLSLAVEFFDILSKLYGSWATNQMLSGAT